MPEPSEAPAADPPRASPYGPLAFLLLIAGLGALALVSLCAPPRPVAGLPADPDAEAARTLVHDRLAVRTGALRFHSALLGADPPRELARGATAFSDDARRAEEHLTATLRRHPRDPRAHAALAALDLAALRLAGAQGHYRAALDLAPGYPEARLGLGVVLAMEAETMGDPSRAQGLRLRAISQLRAVPEGAAEYEAALYDRVLVELRAERREQAEGAARDYWRRDPSGEWAEALRRALAPGSG